MSAQTEIIKKYGMPGPEYQAKWCVMWEVKKDFPWFPANKIFLNKDFKNRLYSAFKEIEQKGLQGQIKTYDGCLAERPVRGAEIISLHSWGMAIDLNASTEKLGQATTNFSKEFISCMLAAKLFWGGNFKSRKDPMHFALFNG